MVDEAFIRLAARDLGPHWLGQEASGVRHEVGLVLELLPRGEVTDFDSPLALVLEPAELGHFVPQLDVLAHAVVLGDFDEVVLDLGAGREEPRPLRVVGVGVLVRVRRDIARDASVPVVVPWG